MCRVYVLALNDLQSYKSESPLQREIFRKKNPFSRTTMNGSFGLQSCFPVFVTSQIVNPAYSNLNGWSTAHFKIETCCRCALPRKPRALPLHSASRCQIIKLHIYAATNSVTLWDYGINKFNFIKVSG